MFLPHCFMSLVKMAAMNKVSRILAEIAQLQADSGVSSYEKQLSFGLIFLRHSYQA